MNPDLKLRLTAMDALDEQARCFWRYLINQLGHEALAALSNYTHEDDEKRPDIVVTFEEIETDDDDSAYMTGDGQHFEVVLDPRMPFGMCLDFLLHEYSHVMSWEVADPEEDHCDEFGKAYAHLYRLYLYLYEHFWSDQ